MCEHVADKPLFGNQATTISCGVASVKKGDEAKALLRRADLALYEAKHGGRNRAEGIQEAPI